jgi:hypothetical protein
MRKDALAAKEGHGEKMDLRRGGRGPWMMFISFQDR